MLMFMKNYVAFNMKYSLWIKNTVSENKSAHSVSQSDHDCSNVKRVFLRSELLWNWRLNCSVTNEKSLVTVFFSFVPLGLGAHSQKKSEFQIVVSINYSLHFCQ